MHRRINLTSRVGKTTRLEELGCYTSNGIGSPSSAPETRALPMRRNWWRNPCFPSIQPEWKHDAFKLIGSDGFISKYIFKQSECNSFGGAFHTGCEAWWVHLVSTSSNRPCSLLYFFFFFLIMQSGISFMVNNTKLGNWPEGRGAGFFFFLLHL